MENGRCVPMPVRASQHAEWNKRTTVPSSAYASVFWQSSRYDSIGSEEGIWGLGLGDWMGLATRPNGVATTDLDVSAGCAFDPWHWSMILKYKQITGKSRDSYIKRS
jgi:hypothetical protein